MDAGSSTGAARLRTRASELAEVDLPLTDMRREIGGAHTSAGLPAGAAHALAER